MKSYRTLCNSRPTAINLKWALDEIIKVILLSKAGNEGLDFKCIRQIHILEPWYNLNKIEQIIGRCIREGSHLSLPPEKRN